MYIHQMVTGRASPRQFSIVACPQHHPIFGPIEYTLHSRWLVTQWALSRNAGSRDMH